MWLFTKHGFYSVTEARHTRKRNMKQIRSRNEIDLYNLKDALPILRKKRIYIDSKADYRYRIYVTNEELSQVMALLADSLDYSNFKNKIAKVPNQAEKVGYLGRIWHIMYEYQSEHEKKSRGPKEYFDRGKGLQLLHTP